MEKQQILTQSITPSLLPIPQVDYGDDDVETVIQKVLRYAAESKAAQENREN